MLFLKTGDGPRLVRESRSRFNGSDKFLFRHRITAPLNSIVRRTTSNHAGLTNPARPPKPQHHRSSTQFTPLSFLFQCPLLPVVPPLLLPCCRRRRGHPLSLAPRGPTATTTTRVPHTWPSTPTLTHPQVRQIQHHPSCAPSVPPPVPPPIPPPPLPLPSASSAAPQHRSSMLRNAVQKLGKENVP
jgi:hypothetical protein